MVSFRNLPIFSLGVDFTPLGPPMIFRISAAAELAIFVATKIARTASLSQDCCPFGQPWDTRNAQAPLAKIDTCSKINKFLYLGFSL